MRLSDFRVKARIYTGFGALIALGATLAAIGVTQLKTIEGQVQRLVTVSESTSRALQVSQLVAEMRRVSLIYKTTGDERATTDFTDDEILAADLLTTGAKSARQEERRKLYAGAAEILGQASDNFDKLVKLTKAAQAERAKLIFGDDALSSAAVQLAEEARQGNNQDLAGRAQLVQIAVLLVDTANWRFLATRDAAELNSFQSSIARAGAALEALEKTPGADRLAPELAPVRTALKEYGESFDRLSATLLKSDKLYDEAMRPQLQKVDDMIQVVQKSLTDDLQATRAATDWTIDRTVTGQSVVALVGLLLGIALAIFIGRSIVAPLAGMTQAMKRLASGDKTTEIPAQDNKDEIGEMAKSVGVFKESMLEADRLDAVQRDEQAKKERRQQAIEGYITQFESSIREALEALASASGQLRSTAQSMSSIAEEATNQAAAVAGASEQASANVQTVAASTEEMASSIAEITRQVTQSSEIAAKAVDQAGHTSNTVAGLAQAAHKIGEVVSLIQIIAAQTNLLALNATIEAARAGDAGKGFAVVASEVKSLANQTGKATEDIAAQVTAIQAATNEAVGTIEAINDIITHINEIATAIASSMEEQSATTREITRHTQDAARGTEEVSHNIASVNRAASDTGAAAAQVLASSGDLGQQAEKLRAEVDQFLARIRAA